MRKFSVISLIAAAAMSLAACAPLAKSVGPPDNLVPDIAASTTADERLGLGVEIAFTAAVKGVIIATRAGLIKGEDADKVRAIKDEAFKGVCITRAAYDLANAIPRSADEKQRCDHLLPSILPTFGTAETAAKSAIRRLLALIP